jgi:glycyl-tRNA synthetase
VTIDGETNTSDTVTVRDRDTLEQIRVPVKELVAHVQAKLKS